MNDDQFKARVAEVMAEEQAEPERWLYLSFASDEQFNGAVIVRARGIVGATALVHALGINPGGQVACWDIPDEPPAEFCNRLLSREDVASVFGSAKSIKELNEESE